MKLICLKNELMKREGLYVSQVGRTENIEISDIQYHSQQVQSGDVFVCIRGENTDGHFYAADAVDAGASALIVEEVVEVDDEVPQIVVQNSLEAMGIASDVLFGHPTGELLLFGVTGTSGKTTTSSLIRHILEYSGVSTGLVGTVEDVIGGRRFDSDLTTPQSSDLQRFFRQMIDSGDESAVMEVSSHALELHRVERSAFNIGVFTNLAPEHLDFHQSMEDYLAAKTKLFTMLTSEGAETEATAVLNADDPKSTVIANKTNSSIIYYGINDGDIRASELDLQPDHSRFLLHMPDETIEVDMSLPGRFNVYNATAAAAAVWAAGLKPEKISASLGTAEPIAGRFEVVSRPDDDVIVVVDFAHTPDELENLLETVTDIADHRVIVAFGCGGNRDTSKRPVMGEIAERLADFVMVTSDNPRSEDPQSIIDDVIEGMNDPQTCEACADRSEAVGRCIEVAEPGDVVVLAGKGHETYQVFANEKKVHYDDRQQARFFLRERRRRRGRMRR